MADSERVAVLLMRLPPKVAGWLEDQLKSEVCDGAGILDCRFDPDTGRIAISYHPSVIESADLMQAIDKLVACCPRAEKAAV